VRPPDGATRIEFWGVGREGEVVADLIRDFERLHPGVKVTIQQIPWTAAHEKLLTAHVGDATPDVAQIGNTWIPEFVTVRALEDLSPFLARSQTIDRRDYFDGIWATNVVAGRPYGVPWYVDTRVLFYRTDVLASVGYTKPPRTWSEWRDAMARIRRAKKSRFGILLPTNEFEQMEILAMSNGSRLLDASGTHGAFSQRPFAEAFAFYVGMFRDGDAPEVSNTQIANLYQQFAQGDFAMYITGPWNVGEFRRRLPKSMEGKWSTAPLPAREASQPSGVSMAGGASLVLFRQSQKKEAAWKLIEFLSAREQQIRFSELTGDLPARKSAWAAPSLVNDPEMAAFRTQLERVQPLPPVAEWEQIATAIAQNGEAVVRHAMTEREALADLDRKAGRLLEKRRWVLSRAAAEGSR
jgi:multiple sugar transport system substrate-binding protein